MVTCPNGHTNPPDWEFCEDCGAPIAAVPGSSTIQTWDRPRWFIVMAGVVAVLLVSGGIVAVVVTGGTKHFSSSTPTTIDTTAIHEWWSGAHEHFTELKNALDDSQRALDRLDGAGLEAACQQMHDAAEVEFAGSLAGPEPGPYQRTSGRDRGRPRCRALVPVGRGRLDEQL